MKKDIFVLILALIAVSCSVADTEYPFDQYVVPMDKSCDYPDAGDCRADADCNLQSLDDVINDEAKPWTCCVAGREINYGENYVFDKNDPCAWLIG